MFSKTLCALLLSIALSLMAAAPSITSHPAAEYTAEGQMKFPAQYRDWVFLSSGFDMSYSASAQAAGSHTFDNVFVDPAAYKIFRESGEWPEGTVLVLENRAAAGKGSINQRGNFQSTNLTGIETHVKDSKRFSARWAFFAFENNSKTAQIIPQSADCYSCHAKHGAVDTTFVQFYPTLASFTKSKSRP